MGHGLLCGFRRGLFAIGLADLGKCWRVAAFRADSACETAQKSRAGFAGCKGWAGVKGHALRGRSHVHEQGTEVHSFPNVPPSPVHVRLQSYIAAACAPDAWEPPCGGRPSSCRLLPLSGGKASRDRRVARLRVKTALDLAPMRCASVWLLEKSAGYEREQR